MPKFDTEKSKVKLWVGTPGNKKNGIWFNFLTENKLSESVIITRMSERILNKKYTGIFVTAKFYNNTTNNFIKSIEGKYESPEKAQANIKLWVGFPDVSGNETWYSRMSENHLENDEIIKLMTERLLRGRYHYEFTKAMFFNNQSGMQLITVEGNMIRK